MLGVWSGTHDNSSAKMHLWTHISLWKENVFMGFGWFLPVLPMHALITLLMESKKHLGTEFTLKFPDYILPIYSHCKDTRPYTSFC